MQYSSIREELMFFIKLLCYMS